jgi:uncharacterized protein (TIGR00369 family)
MPKTMSYDELAELLSGSPFHQLLGLELVPTDSETLELAMPFNEEIERAPGTGQFHGGIISSLIDIAGDFALIGELGFGVPTINFRTDYLRPAFNTSLRARARVRHVGRTVGVVDIDVLDDDGRLIAVGRGTYRTREG